MTHFLRFALLYLGLIVLVGRRGSEKFGGGKGEWVTNAPEFAIVTEPNDGDILLN